MENYKSHMLTPDYFDKFTCTADKCPITCCQEWKIAVDADTNRRWKKLLPPDTVSECRKNLSAYTTKKDGQRVIELDAMHRCPFLDDAKLCRLVSAYGDSVLSETCATFPREYHTFHNHKEAMLMPCCPAVIDLWRDTPLNFPQVFEPDALFLIRASIINLIQDTNTSIEEALLESFYVLSELAKHTPITAATVTEYFSPASLTELRVAIRNVELPVADTWMECNELLQDLSVNYIEEGLYAPYLNPLIALAEQFTAPDDHKLTAFHRQLHAYDILFRNYLANEIFSDLLMPEDTIDDMLLHLEWTAMEYASIRQSLFLLCSAEGANDLSYETVRDYIVILSRMTGYEDADIREYLENSFASPIWDWGYFALVVGK